MKKTTKKTVQLNDVFARAMTDKSLLKSLQARPARAKEILARKGMHLSAANLKSLGGLIPPKPNPPPPPPPPWEPTYIVANAILTALDSRINRVEKMVKGAGKRTGRAGR